MSNIKNLTLVNSNCSKLQRNKIQNKTLMTRYKKFNSEYKWYFIKTTNKIASKDPLINASEKWTDIPFETITYFPITFLSESIAIVIDIAVFPYRVIKYKMIENEVLKHHYQKKY